MEYLFLVAVGIAVIALAIWSHKRAEKRSMEIAAWAAEKGFAFSRDKDRGISERFDAFGILRTGDNRYAFNICQGRVNERSLYTFDYHYQTTTTGPKGQRSTVHHEFSAVIVSTALKLKPLSIRNETMLDAIGEFFGLDDIDFELAEFNREFHVTAPDRRWAFDVLHQKAMELMLNSPRFVLEFNGGRVLAYRTTTFTTKEFEEAITLVNGLVDGLPPSVVRELSDSRTGG